MKLLFFLILTIQLQSQNLPHRYGNAKVFYADLIIFDVLNADTAFADMLEYVNEQIGRNMVADLRIDTNLLEIKFKYLDTTYSIFPNKFGEIECEVSIRYFPNRIGYTITDFKHILVQNAIPCSTEIEKEELECYKKPLAPKYWKNIKNDVIGSMNDFIMMIYFSSLKRQPTSKALKMDDYFLARNRK